MSEGLFGIVVYTALADGRCVVDGSSIDVRSCEDSFASCMVGIGTMTVPASSMSSGPL